MASGDKSAILKLREPLTFILPVLPLVPLQNGNLPYPCFLHIHGNVKYSKGVNKIVSSSVAYPEPFLVTELHCLPLPLL